MAELGELLQAAEGGDATASSRLFELLYADLKRLAHHRLHRDGRIEGLDTTALVHESFLRLAERCSLLPSDRAAFFSYVGRVMRSVIVDQARERQAKKRGGDQAFVTLTTDVQAEAFDEVRLLSLNAALDVLERVAPESHRLVEMRYFAGLSVREVAELRGQSERTIAREWDKARGLLQKIMDEA